MKKRANIAVKLLSARIASALLLAAIFITPSYSHEDGIHDSLCTTQLTIPKSGHLSEAKDKQLASQKESKKDSSLKKVIAKNRLATKIRTMVRRSPVVKGAIELKNMLWGKGGWREYYLRRCITIGASLVWGSMVNDELKKGARMRQADEFLRVRIRREKEERERREREFNERQETVRLARAEEHQRYLAERERKEIERREAEERRVRQRQLEDAAQEGDVKRAEALFDQGANVNGGGYFERPALCIAALYGHSEMVKLLLARGARVNQRVGDGWQCSRPEASALAEAVYKNHVEVARVLLDNGAVIDSDGESLVDTAIRRGYAEIAGLLLDAGAQVNMRKKKDGWSESLEDAVDQGHVKVVDAVLRKTNEISDQLSVVLPENNVCELVCDYVGLNSANVVDSNGVTLLDRAIAKSKDDTTMVETLLRRRANVNKASYNGLVFPLTRAIGELCGKTAELLLASKAQVNAVNTSVWFSHTALHEAIRQGWPNMVGRLLESKADIDIVCEGKTSPLHLAVECCEGETEREKELRIEVLKKLVLVDMAGVNKVAKEGLTLLDKAIKRENVEVVEVLLKQGKADANKMSRCGFSQIAPLAWIFAFKQRCYRDAGEENYRFTERDRNMVELLLANNADINAIDPEGQTPLYVVASWGQDNVGYPEAVKLFLERGADLHKTDRKGRTVLHEVVRRYCYPRILTAKILMHNGARLDVMDNKGRSVLDVADENIKPEILREQEGIDALKVCDNLPTVLENFGMPESVGVIVRDYVLPLSYDGKGCELSSRLAQHYLVGNVNDIVMGYAIQPHRLVLKEEIDKRKERWQRELNNKQERLKQERKVQDELAAKRRKKEEAEAVLLQNSLQQEKESVVDTLNAKEGRYFGLSQPPILTV